MHRNIFHLPLLFLDECIHLLGVACHPSILNFLHRWNGLSPLHPLSTMDKQSWSIEQAIIASFKSMYCPSNISHASVGIVGIGGPKAEPHV